MMLGEKVKRLRKERGLTQEELGDAIGVQKAAINKYETGIVVNLKRKTIDSLAKALGVNPVWLMNDDMGWPPVDINEEAAPPKTIEAQIISSKVDRLTEEQRKKLLKLVNDMFDVFESK